MSKTGPKAELASLRRSVRELEKRFLEAHLTPPTLKAPSRGEVLDVAAYVVLVHGAFENYIEGLALWVLTRAVDKWTKQKKATRCTASLLLYRTAPAGDLQQSTVYEKLRNALDEAKSDFSRAIYDNNGVTPKHLRALFYPLGVNVPEDPVLAASLDLVVRLRHQWAHQYRHVAKVVKSAKDAQVAVRDCLKFAEMLSSEAADARP